MESTTREQGEAEVSDVTPSNVEVPLDPLQGEGAQETAPRMTSWEESELSLDDESENVESVSHTEESAEGSKISFPETAAPFLKPTSETSSSASVPPPMSLFEANALLTTFTNQQNIEQICLLLAYVRQAFDAPLSPFHYHALLRVFAYRRDVNEALRLLDAMGTQRRLLNGEGESGTESENDGTRASSSPALPSVPPPFSEFALCHASFPLETYARVMDALHCLAPLDVLPRLLQVIKLAQSRFTFTVRGAKSSIGFLWSRDFSGSEGGTLAGLSLRDKETIAGDPNLMPGPLPHDEVSEDASPTPPSPSLCVSPPLSSLLHHVCHSNTFLTPLPALLVSFWIQALGLPLSDWDFFHLLSSLIVHRDGYGFTQWCGSSFSNVQEGVKAGSGQVSAQMLKDRLLSRQKELEQWVEQRKQQSTTASSLPRKLLYYGNEPLDEEALVPRALRLWQELQHSLVIVDSMMESLSAANVPLSSPAPCAVCLNHGAKTWAVMIEGFLRRPGGLGVHQYNPLALHHAVTVLYGFSGKNLTEAVKVLPMAVEQEKESAAGGVSEVALHHLLDIGSLFSRLGEHTISELREPYARKVEEIVQQGHQKRQEAELESLSSENHHLHHGRKNGVVGASQDEEAASPPPRLCMPFSLGIPLSLPTAADLTTLESFTYPLLSTAREAREALHRVAALTNPALTYQPRTIRQLYKQIAEFCARHPSRRNPKLSPEGLEARRKWGLYLEARDAALSLFGSAPKSREVMKYVFTHRNRLPGLRSETVIQRDIASTVRFFSSSRCYGNLFLWPNKEAEEGGRNCSPPRMPGDGNTPLATLAKLPLTGRRSTPEHLRCSPDLVPRYLYDPDVFNPFPHIALKMPFEAVANGAYSRKPHGFFATEDKRSKTEEEEQEEVDVFSELWEILSDPSRMGPDLWYLKNTDMYLVILRCMLHRLDFEGAVKLTKKLTQETRFTHKMDNVLNQCFQEIGDPAGSLVFKVVAGLFDAKISRDGQVKRAKFHEAHEQTALDEE